MPLGLAYEASLGEVEAMDDWILTMIATIKTMAKEREEMLKLQAQ